MNSLQFSEGTSWPVDGLPPVADEMPDACVVLSHGNAGVSARTALWWTDTPRSDGTRIGTIGAFWADDEASTHAILTASLERLRKEGCQLAVGPMNGNTWRSHRFVTGGSDRPPYFLEPRNPPEFPKWWQNAGFAVLSRYSSSVMPLDGSSATSPALRGRLAGAGISIRPIDPARFDDELGIIHALSLKSFSRNILYTPQDLDAFVTAYRKVKGVLRSEFVRIAERDGEACGFVFGIADSEAAARGALPALIVKTLAVDPTSRSAGLGSLLVDELHQAGREAGHAEAIHAMQHESNSSLKITGRHRGSAFRQYALFSKPL